MGSQENRPGENTFDSESDLYINNVKSSDYGMYTCTASNERGAHSAEIQLTGTVHCVSL
jgi:hypothetical protein